VRCHAASKAFAAFLAARSFVTATAFATQFDDTRANGVTRTRAKSAFKALKTQTKRHSTELVGMAITEFQDRCLKLLGHPSKGSDKMQDRGPAEQFLLPLCISTLL